MKTWQVDAKIRVTNDAPTTVDGVLVPAYDYTREMPRFYVRAPDASEAITQAVRVCCASCSPRDKFYSSGSVMSVQFSGRSVLTDSSTERSWHDIPSEEHKS